MGQSHPATDRPSLAWLTPFTRRSAVGACSRRVVEAMATYFDVEVWHPDLDDRLETEVLCRPFHSLDGVSSRCLERYDHVVYNLGNNYEFHSGIWHTAQRHPGVIIFHDAVMYHFFAELYLRTKNDRGGFLALFDRLYGGEAAERVSRSLCGLEPPLSETAAIEDWSLIEAAVPLALGVIVHSEYCKARIEEIVECPMVKAELPVERPVVRSVLGRRHLGIPSNRVLIVVAGGMNRNKRVESVIRALGALRLRVVRVTLALVGSMSQEESARLKGIARSLGIEKWILFKGLASDEEFYSYLSHADICVNLRYPNTEGASASLVEEMLFNNAVVVLDTGVFRELPDYAVSRVRLAYEHQDLVRALEELIQSSERRKELATRARSYAERVYRTDLYAEKVRQVLGASATASPLLRLADLVSEILSDIGCYRGSTTVESLTRSVHEIFLPRLVTGRTPSRR